MPFEELSDTYKEVMFHQDKCRESYNERIKSVRLPVSSDSLCVISAFAKVLPELSDSQLNLSDVDGEYEQLIKAITTTHKKGNHEVHPGILMLMCNTIQRQPAKQYSESIEDRLRVFIATQATKKALTALNDPIREECLKEFHDAATADELADIRSIVKHHESPQNAGMPGNGMVKQYGR